ncbi:MAG: hypothetical protein FJ118_20260 [Deltaproteobacteria bacterium]|nr:hypothetical protein [Deltaproteobacteria bacterium]
MILDLDGDGIETTNVRGRAFFDHDMDGFAEQTGWVTPDDGLLVMDRNGDGVINDGTELFGSHTLARDGSTAANGFQVLPDLDSNHDGKIDATDSAFSQLRVWQDSDGDGYSRPDELFNLDQLGITAINLDSAITNSTDAQGNTRTRTGTFEKADGTTGQIGEYNLQSDATYNIPTEWLNVPQDIAALPDLRGYGTVHDLHQAMVRDTTGQLKSIVEQFMI